MSDMKFTPDFTELAATEYASVLPREQFMDAGIKPLWDEMPIFAGPALTVQLQSGDHLMLHHAIYQASPGDVIVIDGVDDKFAVAGGNVCAIAQRLGIAGFVVDGAIRDVAEIRELEFPVLARSVAPYPGQKHIVSPLNQPINCGNVRVNAGDIIIANEEGIVVLPAHQAHDLFTQAQQKYAQEQAMSLDEWQAQHKEKVMQAMSKIDQQID